METKESCDFSWGTNQKRNTRLSETALDRITHISTVEVMLTRHLFNLCQNPHPHPTHPPPPPTQPPHPTPPHTQNLTTTSPVTGSLIKLTGAGLSGQAKTSEPSPSCHGMMDLSTTGCQAATQVHLPVGVHQETLAKHPVDQIICIYLL